ncbi:MAG TPA: histidinol dehydrogenase [Actinomycetota bacterium]
MLEIVDLRGFTGDPSPMMPRATADLGAARTAVREVVRTVRERGDAGLIECEMRFGRERVDYLRIPEWRIEQALDECPGSLRDALESAAARIHDYHARQAGEERAPFWRIGPGHAQVGEETRPIRRAGCYVPGGRAAYPSTVLMTAIPARAAGVSEIAVCVPPSADGRVHAATLTACAIAGVDEVYACGGAQAVAAMAYGTESIRRVDKIVGPGSIWVTLAKHEVAMDVGVDSFAGPTEVAIIADGTAPPEFLAADLVAQAEHDPLATCLLVTPSRALIDAINDLLPKEVAAASRAADIESALRTYGRAILVDGLEQAVEVVDAFAPEHLELALVDADSWLPKISNAGAIFIGVWSPVSLGDYVAGTNHVLPTAGASRFASPLRVSDFIKSTATIRFEPAGIEWVAPWAVAIAGEEGLDAHARALNVRLDHIHSSMSQDGSAHEAPESPAAGEPL